MSAALPHDWCPRPLPDNVRLGARSWLYSSYAFLHYRSMRPHGVRIGDDSGIYDGTFFELGPHGEVDIGSFCTLVGAIIRTDGRVTIGDHSFLAHEVVLADRYDARPVRGTGGGGAPPPDTPGIAPHESIALGCGVWVGARAVLLGGTRIGDGAIIGAGAVVRGSVAAQAIVAGNPARVCGSTRP